MAIGTNTMSLRTKFDRTGLDENWRLCPGCVVSLTVWMKSAPPHGEVQPCD